MPNRNALAQRVQRREQLKVPCAWFALCDRKATGTTPHSILGQVSTCDRCHEFATGEKRAIRMR